MCFSFFFMLALLVENIFLTTLYGLNFNHHLHITFIQFFKFLLCSLQWVQQPCPRVSTQSKNENLRSIQIQINILQELRMYKLSPLPGFKPGTSPVPRQCTTNWAVLACITLSVCMLLYVLFVCLCLSIFVFLHLCCVFVNLCLYFIFSLSIGVCLSVVMFQLSFVWPLFVQKQGRSSASFGVSARCVSWPLSLSRSFYFTLS